MGALNDKMLFSAYEPEHGNELWISDGTSDGTALVADIIPGVNTDPPTSLGVYLGKLFLSVPAANGTSSFWVSDGTGPGTQQLATIEPGSLTEFNGKLYFRAFNRAHSQYEIWVSDGTPAGTALASDINFRFGFDSATVLNNRLYYYNMDETQPGLWSTDGTAAGPTS
jgi:ELWxxDGT repeat protein